MRNPDGRTARLSASWVWLSVCREVSPTTIFYFKSGCQHAGLRRRRIYPAFHTAGWTFGIHSTASEFAGDDYPDGGDLFSDSKSNEAPALSQPL
jgi:hypothetical protein